MKFHKGWMIAVVIFLVVILSAWFVLQRALNPIDRNKIVLIWENWDSLRIPHDVSLKGEVNWSQKLTLHSGSGLSTPSGFPLIVSDIENAWFDGKLSIHDKEGLEISNTTISPPGRYCGTLVIFISDNHTSRASWNHLSIEANTEETERPQPSAL